MVDFKVLRRDASGVQLDQLKGFKLDFMLGRGESVRASYPKKGASYGVDLSDVTRPGPERPGKAGKRPASVDLRDLLAGGDQQTLTVSARMKELIATSESEIEFLPVAIKGYSEPYFIANVLQHVSCLDVKASGATLDSEGMA
ncbi:MAG: hypothetical protein M3154_12185, partial [Candidatus Eremiobacteraeota bacterium]|nr:hypothetical protein [Candidatus Eremiobacteraeota bacterium]